MQPAGRQLSDRCRLLPAARSTSSGAALAPYPNLKAKSRTEFVADEQKSVNQLLGLIYVPLALAVVVALIGIVNTLMPVGAPRGQARRAASDLHRVGVRVPVTVM